MDTLHVAYIKAAFESLRRGDSTRWATCLCGWKGPQRATLELAADDALLHERSDMCVVASSQIVEDPDMCVVASSQIVEDRRSELVRRIASNKDWLSNNFHLGKDVRRDCRANIEADEEELAKLDEQPPQ